ncbi:MAG TPA: hypothetical protein VGN26_16785 [Armatimonadota bacterium]|jgi:hypothetical protein
MTLGLPRPGAGSPPWIARWGALVLPALLLGACALASPVTAKAAVSQPSPLPTRVGPSTQELAALLREQASWRETLEAWHQKELADLRASGLPEDLRAQREALLEQTHQAEMARVAEAQSQRVRGLYLDLSVPPLPPVSLQKRLKLSDRQALFAARYRWSQTTRSLLANSLMPRDKWREALRYTQTTYLKSHRSLLSKVQPQLQLAARQAPARH